MESDNLALHVRHERTARRCAHLGIRAADVHLPGDSSCIRARHRARITKWMLPIPMICARLGLSDARTDLFSFRFDRSNREKIEKFLRTLHTWLQEQEYKAFARSEP